MAFCTKTDIEKDRLFNARTVPLSLVTAFFLHMALLWTSPLAFNIVLMLTAVTANDFLLLQPSSIGQHTFFSPFFNLILICGE